MSAEGKKDKSGSTASEPKVDQKDPEKDGKNATNILCQRCDSVILKPGCATLFQKEMFLPFMHKKSETQSPEDGGIVSNCWIVDNMFTFENVGFSNTVNTTKFLICADCEIGPIGWHDVNDNSAFYISVERIKYG